MVNGINMSEPKCGHHFTVLEKPTNTIIAEKYGYTDQACRSCFPELFTRIGISKDFSPEQYENVIEAIEYIRAVFPPSFLFDNLVKGEPVAYDDHTISGDDLAGACHHLSILMKIFDVED